MRKRSILLAAVVSLTTIALAAPVAMADPTGAPTTRTLVGVGSDTTQDVMNALSNVPASGSRTIGSYDAVGGATLPALKTAVTSSNEAADCSGIARPVGSGAGVSALKAERGLAATDANGVRRPCIDFARSSSGPNPVTGSPTLTWIPFAGDQVTVATREDTLLPASFTTAQLTSIYNCTAAATQSQNGNPPAIVPVLPQSNSGTRKFFLAQIMVTTPGSCVQSTTTTIENNGAQFTDPRDLFPYSVAQYNSQYYKVVTDVTGSMRLRQVNSQIPGTSSFPFKREVYNVVPTSELNDPAIQATFVGTGDPGDICNQSATIQRYGFSLVSDCGTTTLVGDVDPGGGDLPGPQA